MALEVTTAELDALAKRIIDVDGETQGTLRQVQSAVDTVSSTWKGEAATAFNNLMARFHDDAAKLQEALRSIAEQISSSADVYARQEEDNRSSIGGLAGRLQG